MTVVSSVARGVSHGVASGVVVNNDWTPAALPSLVGWWEPAKTSTLFQERTGASATTPSVVDGAVGTVMDLSGAGNHLTTPTGDLKRPTLKSSGGLVWLEFDGGDDNLRAVFSYTAPAHRVSAFVQVTQSAGDFLIDGAGTNTSWPITQEDPGVTVGGLRRNGGAAIGSVAMGTSFVLTELSKTGTSAARWQINNATALTGTISTINGTSIGARGDGAANFGNIRWYGTVLVNAELSETNLTLLKKYMAARCGVTL